MLTKNKHRHHHTNQDQVPVKEEHKLSAEEKRKIAYEWFIDPSHRSVRDYCHEQNVLPALGFLRKAREELRLSSLRTNRNNDVDANVLQQLSAFIPKTWKNATAENEQILMEFVEDESDTPLLKFLKARKAVHLLPVARRLRLKGRRERCRANPSLKQKVGKDIEAACRSEISVEEVTPTPAAMPLSNPHIARAFLTEWMDQLDNPSLVHFFRQKDVLPTEDLRALRQIAKCANLFLLRHFRDDAEKREKALAKLEELLAPYNAPNTDTNTLQTLLREWYNHQPPISPIRFLKTQNQLSYRTDMKRAIHRNRLCHLRKHRRDSSKQTLAMKRISAVSVSNTTTLYGISISRKDEKVVKQYVREWVCGRISIRDLCESKGRLDLVPLMKRMVKELELKEMRKEYLETGKKVKLKLKGVFPKQKINQEDKGAKEVVEGDFVIAETLDDLEQEAKKVSLEDDDVPMGMDDDDDDDDDSDGVDDDDDDDNDDDDDDDGESDDSGSSDDEEMEEEEGIVSVASVSAVTKQA